MDILPHPAIVARLPTTRLARVFCRQIGCVATGGAKVEMGVFSWSLILGSTFDRYLAKLQHCCKAPKGRLYDAYDGQEGGILYKNPVPTLH